MCSWASTLRAGARSWRASSRRAHWREGLALEACRVVVDSAFAIGLTQVWARADAENVASIAAMERLGMRRDDAPTTDGDVEPAEKNSVRYVLDRT